MQPSVTRNALCSLYVVLRILYIVHPDCFVALPAPPPHRHSPFNSSSHTPIPGSIWFNIEECERPKDGAPSILSSWNEAGRINSGSACARLLPSFAMLGYGGLTRRPACPLRRLGSISFALCTLYVVLCTSYFLARKVPSAPKLNAEGICGREGIVVYFKRTIFLVIVLPDPSELFMDNLQKYEPDGILCPRSSFASQTI